jgi:Zn finger protein HypA/HybF involved in hydrogenase expression
MIQSGITCSCRSLMYLCCPRYMCFHDIISESVLASSRFDMETKPPRILCYSCHHVMKGSSAIDISQALDQHL